MYNDSAYVMKVSLRLPALSFILWILAFPPVHAAEDEGQSILVLNSYHHGYTWGDRTEEGIRAVFDSTSSVNLYYEFMDTKHVWGETYLDRLAKLYRFKYPPGSFDLIIASDINALDFLRHYRQTVFTGTPVVFAGIAPAGREAAGTNGTLPQEERWYTGVYVDVELTDTLALLHRLHPDLKQIFAICDTSPVGVQLRHSLDAAVVSDGGLTVHYLDSGRLDTIEQEVAGLPSDSVLLFLLLRETPPSTHVGYSEVASRVAAAADVPVYSPFAMYLGTGVVGGLMTDSYQLGRDAAIMARRVLAGNDVSTIPEKRIVSHRYMFDYPVLMRFGIPLSDLPAGSQVIHRPLSVYSITRSTVLTALGLFVVLGSLIIALLVVIGRRRRIERMLRDKQAEIEASLHQARVVSDLALNLNSLSSRLGDRILEDTSRLVSELGVDRVYLHLSQETESDASFALALSLPEPPPALADLCARLFVDRCDDPSAGIPVVSHALEELQEDERPGMVRAGIRSFLGFSLCVEQHMIGRILYTRGHEHVWSPEEVDVLFTIANVLAVTLERMNSEYARLEAERKILAAREVLDRSTRLSSLGVMAAGITHEINQPLNAIKVIADGILYSRKKNSEQLSDSQFEKIRRISEGAARIDQIIRHMRTFWIEREIKPADVLDLRPVVDSALSLIDAQLRKHAAVLRVQQSDSALPVRAIQTQLEQIVINLVTNALQAVDHAERNQKEIEVVTRLDTHHVLLTVSDNGVGLPEEAGERIYDPFFSSKVPGEGTGLGLAVTRTFVERFGGTIVAANRPEGGATFTVSFPKATLEHQAREGVHHEHPRSR